MTEQQITRHEQMYTAFQEGHITPREWEAFCQCVFEELLTEMQPMFVRMQNEWRN